MSEVLIKNKLDSSKFRDAHNPNEWTKELDEALKKSVLSNYFNFNIISLEINDEAQRLGLRFGIANAYTNEKCRLRWFFLHCNRSLEIKKKEKEEKKNNSNYAHCNKENSNPDLLSKMEAKPIHPSLFTEKEFKEDFHQAGAPMVKNKLKVASTIKIIPKKSPPVVINETPVPLDIIDDPRPNFEEVEETKEVEEKMGKKVTFATPKE
jgi:hypothetical protein